MNVRYEYHLAHRHDAKTHTPAHKHTYCELVYYYSGSGTSSAEEKSYRFDGSDIILYSPEVVHDETHFTETEVFCLGFTVPDMKYFNPGYYKDSDGKIGRYIENIRLELSEKLPFYKEVIENCIERILIELNRKLDNQSVLFPVNEEGEMAHIAKFVRENLQYKLNIHTLAEMSGYSYDYFRHIFKKHIGISPKDYLTKCQIEEAQRLLTQTKLSVASVSEHCGFATQEHFSLFFKKNTGMSPLPYRNKNLRSD